MDLWINLRFFDLDMVERPSQSSYNNPYHYNIIIGR